MNKDNINTVAHRWIKENIQPDWICVDATAGNGNDTLFLLQHAKKVYAFDIQLQAKENTLKRTQGYDNLIFHLTGHQNMKQYVHENIDLAIFNFGYLPHADPSCITLPNTSLAAIEAAFSLLNENGYLYLAVYLGHDGGIEEHQAIYQWIIQKRNKIEVRSYTQRKGAPILYEIKKSSR